MQITKDELMQCKRAVVVLSELAKVATDMVKQDLPLEMRADRLVLMKVLRRLEVVAK